MFIELSREVFGHQARQLSERIFDVFDADRSGKIDFLEYMQASNDTFDTF